MHPLKVSAQFAAFTWFRNIHRDQGREEAARYARLNWEKFLPLAHEGLGRLLLRISEPQPKKPARARRVLVAS
jgi:hypothetical protein